MNPSEEQELTEAIELFVERFDAKVRAGHEKHKNSPGDWKDMTALDLLNEALDENLDQFAYIVKAIKKLEEQERQSLFGFPIDETHFE